MKKTKAICLKASIIFLMLLTAAAANATVVRSNRDPRVDQDLRTTASPTFVDLILSGGNILSANSINLKPSGDTDDYISFSTVGDIPRATIIGGSQFDIYSDTISTGFGLKDISDDGLVFSWLDNFHIGSIEADGILKIISSDNLQLQPSGDMTNFFQLSTIANIPTIRAFGGTVFSVAFDSILDVSNVDSRIDPDAILEKSEDSYYRFNGTLAPEAGGGGSPPTLTLTAGTTTYCDRGTAKGHNFDGSSYYTADTPSYKPQTGTGARSVSFWHRPVGSGNRNIFAYGSASGAGQWAGRISATDMFSVLFGDGNANSVIDIVTDGLWHHVVATMDAGDTIGDTLIYIDGELDTGTTYGSGSNPIDTGTAIDLIIGASRAGASPADGCLSDIAFFDTQLSAADVLDIYNRQKPTVIEGTSLPHPGDMAGPILTLGSGTFGSLNVNGEFGFSVDIFGGLNIGQAFIVSTNGDTQIKGALNHDGSTVGFFNTTPITKPANTVALDTLLVSLGLRAFGGVANFDTQVVADAGLDVGSGKFVVEADGDTFWTGAGTGLPYADMHVIDNTTPTVITTMGVAVQVVIFDVSGPSNNATVDLAENHITIVKAGDYKINVSATVNSVAGGGSRFEMSVLKNNGATAVGGLHVDRHLDGGGVSSGSISMTGIVTLAVNDTIEVWIENETGTQNYVVEDSDINLIQVGG